MKLAHIIAIPFTGVGLHGGYRGDKWFRHRIEVFKRFTLKSLSNQSNRNFLIWCWFRPEEKTNPLTMKIYESIKETGLPFFFTFNGLMYWDDKFNSYTPKVALKNLLMMLLDCYMNKEWRSPIEIFRNVWDNKNRTLFRRISSSLPVLKSAIGSDFDWVYLTRLDSDDMLHREAVNLIQSEAPGEGKALVFNGGYIFNAETNQLGEWNPPTNPPFHTIIFPADKFFDPRDHIGYYRDFKTHEDIIRLFNCTTLDVGKYMVLFHGKHISTAWDSPLLKKAYHKVKYGSTEPFRGYCYTVSGENISTRWQSRRKKARNSMIGKEFENKEEILENFGVKLYND